MASSASAGWNGTWPAGSANSNVASVSMHSSPAGVGRSALLSGAERSIRWTDAIHRAAGGELSSVKSPDFTPVHITFQAIEN
jgi:hypothetical protein